MLKSIADAPLELAAPICEFWPAAEWDNAASISFLESGWEWDAINDSTNGGQYACGEVIGMIDGVAVTAEISVGYFQINWCNYQGWKIGTLYNARQNAGTAHALWAERGWSPWHFSAKQLGLL